MAEPPPPPPGGGEWDGGSFHDTLGEARRRAEEARRQMEDEARHASGPQSRATQEELMELQLRLLRFPTLDSKAHNALAALEVKDAIKALSELEAKGGGIRNPSAWICRTAANLRDRQKEHEQPPGMGAGAAGGAGAGGDGGGGGAVDDIVNHYEALDVTEMSDEKEIKKMYRKLVLKWHPDKNPDNREGAEEKIRAINNAYETLSNATKKAAYDAQRQAMIRKARGMGPDLAQQGAPRQRIPREFMLQPIGFPDKFMRYGAEKARSSCFVNSRADAKSEGMGGLESFAPFFNAAKLSLWWLPDVNNMCRIRALEARTRSSAGEKVVAGRPGGLNLGFRIDLDSVGETEVFLIEAGKGEKMEMVNFIVVPSPLYDNAYRFQGAYRRGYYLAFRPPCSLRMVPYTGGEVPARTVLDFTLVDFQAMFKFIDVEEVLKPVIEAKTGWVTLEELKKDANVVAYFGNILQKPIWDDEDFQMYFEGHYEDWEFKVNNGTPAVRLRGVDERLSYALQKVKGADEAAALILSTGDDIKKLPWKCAATSFEALRSSSPQHPMQMDVSAVLQRVEAARRLLGAVGPVLAAAHGEAPLAELARLGEALRGMSQDGGAPDVSKRCDDACSALAKVVIARLAAGKRGGADAGRASCKLEEIGSLLALPGVGEYGDWLARNTVPKLEDAPMKTLLNAMLTAKAVGAEPFAKEAALVALKHVADEGTSAAEAAGALQAIASSGVLLDECAAALAKRAAAMETGVLATTIVPLGDKAHESADLASACSELAGRRSDLARLPAVGLSALTVSATKSSSLGACTGPVLEAAAVGLGKWPVADAIKFLLAATKTKGDAVPAATWGVFLPAAAEAIGPKLSELPAAELVRLALAAGSAVSKTRGVGDNANASRLLEDVAKEATRRVSDMPQAHLLLLTQGLVGLGGKHRAMREICSYWGGVLREDSSEVDEVTRRRKEMEAAKGLTAEQVAKLAMVLEPLAEGLDDETAQDCFGGIGSKILESAGKLTEASRSSLLEQVKAGKGIGLWQSGKAKLQKALDKRARSRSRRRRSSSSSSRGKRRKRSSSSSSRRDRKRR